MKKLLRIKRKGAMKPKPPVWTTRDGRQLLPKDMSTSHLIASIRLAAWKSRRPMLFDALEALSYASSAPDGAAMAAEGAAHSLIDGARDAAARIEYARRESPIVEAMYKELSTRKLTVESVLI